MAVNNLDTSKVFAVQATEKEQAFAERFFAFLEKEKVGWHEIGCLSRICGALSGAMSGVAFEDAAEAARGNFEAGYHEVGVPSRKKYEAKKDSSTH